MNFRLRTSRYVEKQLKQLQASTQLTPNILARLAVALSLRDPNPVSTELSDQNGLEFNRNTLTGQYDEIFKALMAQHMGRSITDSEYFPQLFNAHLERGVRYLVNEYKHAGNYDKFLINLFHLGATE